MNYWERDLPGGTIEYAAEEYPKGCWYVVVPGFPASAHNTPYYDIAAFNAKRFDWRPAAKDVVTQAFQNAWLFMYERWPAELLPPTRVRSCACGCGSPAIDGSIYAVPRLCKVRACRRRGKKRPVKNSPEQFQETVIGLEWFELRYHRSADDLRWTVSRKVDGGNPSATVEGFVNFQCTCIVETEEVFDTCLEYAGCIAKIDYKNVEYHRVLWLIVQHFALGPNAQLLLDEGAEWRATAKRRLDKASALMPVTFGNRDKFIEILLGLEGPKRASKKPPKLNKEATEVLNHVLRFVNNRPDHTARGVSRIAFGDTQLDEIRIALNILVQEGKIDRQKRGGDFFYGPIGYYASRKIETN